MKTHAPRPNRALALAAPLTAIALLAAGCPQQAAQRDQTDPAAARAFHHAPPGVPGANRRFAGTTLHYYTYPVGAGAELDRALAERFKADTGITVELSARPQTTDEIYAAYQRLFKAKQPDYDVLMLDVIWPGAMAPHLRDLSADLAEAAQGAFPEIVLNDTINGKLVAMPYYVDAGMLFYRTDLLKKYHYPTPPATWQQLEQMASTIQAGERKLLPDFSGYVWEGRAYEGLTCNALEWQVSHGGGEIFDAETGAANVNNPQAVAAFKRAAGWVGRISPRAVLTFQEEDARKRFEAGKAAFMRNWPYAYASANAEGSPIAGKLDVAPLPRDANAEHGASTLGGWQLGVSAYSAHPEAAVAFVKYLSSPDVQRWRAIEGSFLPTRRAVYDDAELLRSRPFMKNVPAVMEQAVARPSGRTRERYARVSRVYYTGVFQILKGAPAQATCNAMQRSLQALLK